MSVNGNGNAFQRRGGDLGILVIRIAIEFTPGKGSLVYLELDAGSVRDEAGNPLTVAHYVFILGLLLEDLILEEMTGKVIDDLKRRCEDCSMTEILRRRDVS